MKKSIILLTVILFMFSVTQVFAQNKIRAKGMATIQKNLVDIARSKALDEAQRNAVEKAAGVMITGTTLVENYQVKMDSILAESKGFINTYSITSENKSGGNYEVEIEADVRIGKLRDKMTAINLIMARKSKPRIMLLFKDKLAKYAVAEAAMIKYFIANNFKMVDAEIIKKNKDYERLQDEAGKKAISGIAHRYGAEVIIVGSVEAISNSYNINNIEINNNKVVIAGKVINGDTGEIVTTASETKSAPGMKGDFKALTEDVATKVARKLVDEVLETWSSELTNTTNVKLIISGLASYSDLQHFKASLSEEVKGFKGLNQRYYSKGKAEFDLEIKGDTQAVAHDVEQITINNKKIKVTETSQNRVDAVVVH